ncbi:uncharacterized protein si:ch1073-220m6.1 [Acanthochromis polyacanthus]|uniref:uncharacterized protein si:ch1073-220m6.1 n=1 Tax=Acanthochromis polyacanthus TaxID=80966 RepID=UPI000B8FFEFD|nr:uncharacterized protein si:ch1073-220m6.1 [Acanthochromis polyacanthus]
MLLLLLSCWIITGIMTSSSSKMYYALKNSSVCLHVQKPPPYERGGWTFAGKSIANERRINPNYEKRVVYSPGNLSLCIKELNDSDTGIYEVSFEDSDYNAKSEEHHVIVEEIIPRPVILISVVQSNLTAGFCNITGNCSIQDDWLSFVCEEDSCRTSQKSFSKVNFTIDIDNTNINCSASNHVSRNDASESITMCYHEAKSEQGEEFPQSPETRLITGVCGGVVLLICAVIFAIFACRHDRVRPHAPEVIQSQPMEAHPLSEPRVSTSSSSQAEASYENVDITQPNQTSSPREELGSKQSHEVNTTYSVVQRPKAATCLGKSDNSNNTNGHENIQEALTSESVNVDEAQRSTHVDTVYTVLQKPKNLKPQHHQ